MGAALRFRAEILDPTQNALGRVAAGLTESFNAQHQLGLDASGNLGAGFFVPGQASVVANANNAGGALSAVITDVSALTTSNYTLTALGGNAYSLVRDSDDQTTAINTAGVTPFTATTIDGFDLTITAGAALGDTFQIRPVSAHAGTMKVNLTDPTTIATAAPVRALTAFANTGSANLGSVEINSRANLPLTGAPVNGQIDITFSSATNQLTLVPDPLGEGPLAFDPSVDSAGKNFSILGGDISFRFSGTPGNADTFVLEHNSGGVGDNRNALALSNIQDQSLLGASTATLQQAYGQAVTDVGERTRDGQITDGAFSALLEQATADRDRISGVNLDEEAADLVRFQQAYQASARLITVVDELFQTIINSLR